MTAEPCVVELTDVRKVFDGDSEVVALDQVDLAVSTGDFLAIVGRSGSGKTTLLNILGLMDRPSSGTYRLDGLDTSELSPGDQSITRATSVGFVFQAFHLLGSRSVLDNVAMAGLYNGTSRSDRRSAATAMLERVGMGHRSSMSPTVLSGGERQRVAIARALASAPRLLLADEPTGNLDSSTSAEILDLFGELHADGVTIVMITHDHAIADRAQRQATMIDGRLRA